MGPALRRIVLNDKVTMAKPELGTKRVCVSCSTRFYDLTKVPAICPKCGTEQPLDQPRTRRPVGNLPPEDRRPKKVAPDPEDQDAEAEPAEEEAETEDAAEDTDDIDDDADVIGTDIEVETDGDEPER